MSAKHANPLPYQLAEDYSHTIGQMIPSKRRA